MREDKVKGFMEMAQGLARMGTCVRRRVGCVLLDARHDVLAVGYNGPVSGSVHCTDDSSLCPGADSESGSDLNLCRAMHAEKNAISKCEQPNLIQIAFITCLPCNKCMELLLRTGCKTIYYADDYPSNSIERWNKAGREIINCKN